MTEKLYYKDSFLNEFKGTVISCEAGKKGWEIILDKTVFYPEGGGQAYDIGTLSYEEKIVNVLEVHEKNEEVVHYTDLYIEPGTQVLGKIDWERRFDLMQQHTGEHIFSGVIHGMFGYNNVGFHLSDNYNMVDIDGPLTREDIDTVVDKCNEIVWKNQPVIADFPENLDEIDYRSKKELTGKVRIVTAGEADVCACCGTHTKTTAQAGPIVVTNYQAYKGGERINILCGKRAVDYLRRINDDCLSISHSLSVPVENIKSAFENRMKELENTKYELVAVKRQLMSVYVEKTQVKDGTAVISMKNLSPDLIQTLALMLFEKSDTAVAYSKQEDGKIKVCIVSKTKDTNKLGKFISKELGGKGGGKPGIYQGFFEKDTSDEELENIIKSFE